MREGCVNPLIASSVPTGPQPLIVSNRAIGGGLEDRFGYGAIVRAMRPEEREEMLGLLLEAVAGEMPAGAEEEPPVCFVK